VAAAGTKRCLPSSRFRLFVAPLPNIQPAVRWESALFGPEDRLYMPPLIQGKSLLAETTDQAFRQVFTDLLLLYRRVFEQVVIAAVPEREDLEPAP
jgi:hypothetical protein